jgi:hypothetical protein
MSTPDLSIRQNDDQNRFEVQVDGHLAVVEYMDRGERIVFTHTEVPKGLEGQGIGSQLAEHVLTYARTQHKVVVPLCPFIAAYIRRHPEYQDLVLPGYHY